MPDRWSVASFSDLGDFVNGFAFKPTHWHDVGMPIIKIKELKNGVTAATPRYPGDDVKEKYRVRAGDLLFSWSGDLDAYLWPGPEGWLNQHLFRVDERPGVPRSWLYLALRERMSEFRLRSQGTTMKHIQRSALEQVQVVRPADSVLAAFDDAVAPILELCTAIEHELSLITAARDMLLPKLIAGTVNVLSLGVDDAFGWAEAGGARATA
jgi:type I restriction enzyme S subunit